MEAYDRRSAPSAPGGSSTRCRRSPRTAACPWPRWRWPGSPTGPAVSSTILGARTTEQLEANLRAAGLHLTADRDGALNEASDPHPADYPYGELGVHQRDRKIAGDA